MTTMLHLPPYEIFPTLIGDNVILREIELSDIGDIVEISFYDGVQASSLEQAIAIQEKINDDYDNGNSIHWGIVDKLTNQIVGTCGYYRGLSEGVGELGCVLLPQYFGKGLMTSAMFLAIEYGRNCINLQRIYAITSADNKKAIELLSRLQFIKTATLEEDYLEFELK